MKKIATLIGIAVLTSATTLAIAGGDFCQKKFDGQGPQHSQMQNKSHHCEMSQKYSGMHAERHFKGHGKMCGYQGKHAMMDKNSSTEKRQALMQLKVENKIERMTKRLDLTAEQQKQVREILQDNQQQMLKLRQQQRDAIHKILTEEQQAKKAQFAHGPRA
ncbi:conserved exported hypothetical protein [uncultured Thiomicrorhabdus sp.]